MTESVTYTFENIRSFFPHTPDLIYFNSAAYGPFSTPLKDAIVANIDQRLAASRDDSHYVHKVAEELRQDYATLIGAEQKQVGIGMHTTFGLNIAAFGLPLAAGDEVLVSDVEFPAAFYTWRAAAEARGLKVRLLKSRERCFDIAEFEREITSKTRVLCVSFVQFFNGYKNDLARIGEICRKNGLYFVVDAIQGVGVEPIDVRALEIDVLTSGCQKWMLSPQGCGFFYLSDSVRDRIVPPFMSWVGADWGMNFTDLFHFDRPLMDSARRFEMGYYAVLNLMGMKAAMQYFKDLGVPEIRKHNHGLIDRLASYVKSNRFYAITSNMEEAHRSSIFTFSCKDVNTLHRKILDARIVLVVREGSIRVSAHLFNNEADIDRLIGVLEEFSHAESSPS
jgi:cysteine desulfurase/selenocysteine lyase